MSEMKHEKKKNRINNIVGGLILAFWANKGVT